MAETGDGAQRWAVEKGGGGLEVRLQLARAVGVQSWAGASRIATHTRGYQMREEGKTREWIMNQYSDERTQETKCQLRHQQEHLNKHEGGRPAADNQSIGGENRTVPASQHSGGLALGPSTPARATTATRLSSTTCTRQIINLVLASTWTGPSQPTYLLACVQLDTVITRGQK